MCTHSLLASETAHDQPYLYLRDARKKGEMSELPFRKRRNRKRAWLPSLFSEEQRGFSQDACSRLGPPVAQPWLAKFPCSYQRPRLLLPALVSCIRDTALSLQQLTARGIVKKTKLLSLPPCLVHLYIYLLQDIKGVEGSYSYWLTNKY